MTFIGFLSSIFYLSYVRARRLENSQLVVDQIIKILPAVEFLPIFPKINIARTLQTRIYVQIVSRKFPLVQSIPIMLAACLN